MKPHNPRGPGGAAGAPHAPPDALVAALGLGVLPPPPPPLVPHPSATPATSVAPTPPQPSGDNGECVLLVARPAAGYDPRAVGDSNEPRLIMSPDGNLAVDMPITVESHAKLVLPTRKCCVCSCARRYTAEHVEGTTAALSMAAAYAERHATIPSVSYCAAYVILLGAVCAMASTAAGIKILAAGSTDSALVPVLLVVCGVVVMPVFTAIMLAISDGWQAAWLLTVLAAHAEMADAQATDPTAAVVMSASPPFYPVPSWISWEVPTLHVVIIRAPTPAAAAVIRTEAAVQLLGNDPAHARAVIPIFGGLLGACGLLTVCLCRAACPSLVYTTPTARRLVEVGRTALLAMRDAQRHLLAAASSPGASAAHLSPGGGVTVVAVLAPGPRAAGAEL